MRNVLIFEAVYNYGYTLKELGDFLGLHYPTVRRILQRIKERSKGKTLTVLSSP